jgi:hypothetical protein
MAKDEVIARIKLSPDRVLVRWIQFHKFIETATDIGPGLATGEVVAASEDTSPYRDRTVMYPRGEHFFELTDGDIFHVVNVKDILGVIDDQE